MFSDATEEWLAGLKSGDKVLLVRSKGMALSAESTIVFKATATLLKVGISSSNLRTFRRRNGSWVDGGEWASHHLSLHEPTEDNMAESRRLAMLNRIAARRQHLVMGYERAVVEKLTDEEVDQIADLIRAAKGRP